MRILGQLTRGRFVVRLLGRRTERAREFPAPPPAAVVDDSVFALYLPVAWQGRPRPVTVTAVRSEEHTSELQSLTNLVCRLLLEKKNQRTKEGIWGRTSATRRNESWSSVASVTH